MTIDPLNHVLAAVLIAATLIFSYHSFQYYRSRRRLKDLIATNQEYAATLTNLQVEAAKTLVALSAVTCGDTGPYGTACCTMPQGHVGSHQSAMALWPQDKDIYIPEEGK